MKNRMSNDVRRFIRFLGEHNEYKVISTEAETRFALGFYHVAHANQFLSAFQVLYDKNIAGGAFGLEEADKVCQEFIHRIYLGVVDAELPYLHQRSLGSDSIPAMSWVSFWPQEQLVLVERAFLELRLDYYTPSFERDYDE